MSEYDVVSVGAGHNALTTAAYLAKAGKKVLLLERNDWYGGGVVTQELTGPGFKSDLHSGLHHLILANPLIRADELGLQREFGLEYIYADCAMSSFYDDDTMLAFYPDREKTLASISQYSERDAEAFAELVDACQPIIEGLSQTWFVPPPDPLVQAQMMAQSPFALDMMVMTGKSALDVICENFEDPHLRSGLLRFTTEVTLAHPREKGCGMWPVAIFGMIEMFGMALPKGGSGELAGSLVRCLEAHGATIQTGTEVERVLIEGGRAVGVVTKDGEEVRANDCVIGTIHPHHLGRYFDGLDPRLLRKAANTQLSPLSNFCVHGQLDESLRYRGGNAPAGGFASSMQPVDLDKVIEAYEYQERGLLTGPPIAGAGEPTLLDPSRAPEGEHIFHLSSIAPYDLADGGGAAWPSQADAHADRLLDYVAEYTVNFDRDSLKNRYLVTPLQIESDSPSFVRGDLIGLASWAYQSGGMRPIPELANYTIPGVEGFYLTGPSQHPGGAVTGGGRATAVKIFEDLGLDFESTIGAPVVAAISMSRPNP